ncbi:MAG: hypothetical protein IT564_11460 [Rhodospirillales bacterium]|nr:hypothetical protein [Rhodospirillales bacterium]
MKLSDIIALYPDHEHIIRPWCELQFIMSLSHKQQEVLDDQIWQLERERRDAERQGWPKWAMACDLSIWHLQQQKGILDRCIRGEWERLGGLLPWKCRYDLDVYWTRCIYPEMKAAHESKYNTITF